MAYLLSWVLWLLYAMVATAAMYAFLSLYETVVSRLLGCRSYYVYDFEGILSRVRSLRYTPSNEFMVSMAKSQAVLASPASPAQQVKPVPSNRYDEYRKRVRQALTSKWSFLPEHLVTTAMDLPREEVLSMQPTADGWAGRMLTVVSGWLAADTGLPSDLVSGVLDTRDIEDQVRLADVEMVLMDIVEAYPGVRDLVDVPTAAAVFRTLRNKNRPLMKAADYVKTASAYMAVETCDPSVSSMFSIGGMTDEQWMSLRYRSKDF